MPTLTSDNPEFWQARYQENDTPWNLGEASPPLVHWWQENSASYKPGKMAVLGCGFGHDAAFFAHQGFDVTGFDYAPEAIQGAIQHYGKVARFEQANIYDLPPQYACRFEYVLEHTCFCAIPPSQRKDYVKVAAALLEPGGVFIGLFFDHGEKGGPPYTSPPEEIEALFSPYFEIARLEKTPHSIERRKDEELLAVFVRKP